MKWIHDPQRSTCSDGDLKKERILTHKQFNSSGRGLLLVLILFFLSGCVIKTPVANIRAAENIRKTSDGRIFVTGREGLFELTQAPSGALTATIAAAHPAASTNPTLCNYYAGLAQLQDWMFFVCVRMSGLSLRTLSFTDAGELLAYSLKDKRVVSIMSLSDYQFANGLDSIITENAIIIANEDFFLSSGGVSKAHIDFSSGQPVLLDYQHHWINAAHGVRSANGVRFIDNTVYLTDIGRFKRVLLSNDGTPTLAETLYRNATVLDDFDVVCRGFLLTDFVKGRLIYVPMNSNDPPLTASGLSTPSAILGDATPLLPKHEILVTESTGLQAGTANQVVRLSLAQLNLVECGEE